MNYFCKICSLSSPDPRSTLPSTECWASHSWGEVGGFALSAGVRLPQILRLRPRKLVWFLHQTKAKMQNKKIKIILSFSQHTYVKVVYELWRPNSQVFCNAVHAAFLQGLFSESCVLCCSSFKVFFDKYETQHIHFVNNWSLVINQWLILTIQSNDWAWDGNSCMVLSPDGKGPSPIPGFGGWIPREDFVKVLTTSREIDSVPNYCSS